MEVKVCIVEEDAMKTGNSEDGSADIDSENEKMACRIKKKE